MSALMYPEVQDATTLGPRFSQSVFLPVAIEGQKDAGGSATVAAVNEVFTPVQAETLFGAASSLATFVKFLLGRGIPSVKAIASASASLPTLVQRQAAWAVLEADPLIRIRLTDSVVQADHVALADSAEFAELIYHKQVAFMGMPAGTTQAALQTAAAAIASKRGVLVGPGIYDENGVLLSGALAACAVAAEVAKNPDITDDLDRMMLSSFTGIERDANGMPIFRKRVTAGTAVNDFETLLTAGVSPLKTGTNGGVEITHLRTTYITDTTFDALQTRLIVDQLFIDVRDYVLNNNFLRRGNTQKTRDDLKAGVEALLRERSNWLLPKAQPDGTMGYMVAIIPSVDLRQVTISYQGVVVRGIQKVLVDGKLEIPV